MRWWLRIRLVPWTLAALTGCAIAAASMPGASMPMPSLAGGLLLPVPLSLLAPLVPSLLALHAVDRAVTAAEDTATRPVPRMDGTYLLLCALLALAAGGCGQALGWWPLGEGFGRNVAGTIGLGLLARWVAGPLAATTAPVAFTVICTFFGVSLGGHARAWAWPLAAPTSLSALVISLLLLTLGLHGIGRRGAWLRH
ncbi:hypothetical protein [Streptacidiphilus albus]|uniref:hypothetical protein n=1 Tax=Streptacidiphilus albus TaxID=105425 RepID=UPI00054C0AE5|nr:hypothetical protein [Streptacidiphilus albus]